MISIVVCSVNDEMFQQFSQNVQSTIGVPFEIIRIDNSRNTHSICSAYNEGKAACRYDVICFIHEDVLFQTGSWGRILLDIFKDPGIGLAGIFGACYLSLFPDAQADLEECQGQVIEGYKEDKPLRRASRFPGNPLTEVAVIDGVFMATRKSIMDKISFSDDILKGFHGYDFDISMQIRRHYKVVVTAKLLLLHISSGSYTAPYFEAMKLLKKKWRRHLPAYTSSYSREEIKRLKIKSLDLLLNKSATGEQRIQNHLTAIRYAAGHGVLFAWLRRLSQKRSRRAVENQVEPQYKNLQIGFEELVGNLNDYFSKHPDEKNKFENEISFLNTDIRPVPGVEKIIYAVLPYPFILDYDYRNVKVFKDEEAGMFYVYLDGKKLYYHKGFTNPEDVQKNFIYVSAEQHPDSPHNYLDHFFSVNNEDTVADLGAAEGNFSLTVVDKVRELIILEADPIWMPALQKTFEPWKDKVSILNKFVGEQNDEHTITLDRIQSKNTISAIKMDIEGAEIGVLKNAASYIRENNIKMAVTTYHRRTDADDIKNLLELNNYETAFSKGYVLFVFDELSPPYFRRGLIKARVKSK